MGSLPFVAGSIWHRPRDVTIQVNVSPRSDASQTDSAARELTLQIKHAKSATELLKLLDEEVDGPIFNYFHVSAAYLKLATKWKGGLTPSEKESPVWPRLAARVQNMIEEGQLDLQAVANVLYSLGKLCDVVDVPEGLLMALAAQISIKAKDMVPQALSNSLWAAARLKAPEVLEMVPALVNQIPRNQTEFFSQDICNCLEGLILLQDSVREVNDFLAAPSKSKNDFLQVAAHRFSRLLPKLKGKKLALEMPVAVWAFARVNFYDEELLVSVAQRGKSGGTLQGLTDWSLCAMLWSYEVLDPDDQFAEFKETLESERVRRGLSDSDVSRSQSGYFEWDRAKG